MVADRIEVTSRRAGSTEAWTWTSSSGSGFDVAPATEEQASRVPRGTEIVLHLKEDAVRYLQPYELERIVRTYSDHVLFPIELIDDKGEARQVNAASALWQRSKSEVTPEDYTQAYRSLAMALRRAGADLALQGRGAAVLCGAAVCAQHATVRSHRSGAQGAGEALRPPRLHHRRCGVAARLIWRFVRGVVDSEDLPLNLSREMLQNNPQVRQIRSGLVGRVLSELESTATKDAEAYGKIWQTFGPILKEGLYEDQERRAQIAGPGALCLDRRRQTAVDQGLCDRPEATPPPPNQTEIYYLVGDSLERLKSNPKLEAAKARGVEVLLLTDPVDAFWTTLPQEFDGKPLKSLSQGEVELRPDPASSTRTQKSRGMPAADAEEDAAVLEAREAGAGGKVAEVRASTRPHGKRVLPGGERAGRGTANSNACSSARIAAAPPSRFLSST